MSLQIIILNTVTNSTDGSFSVSGLFWLTAPSTLTVPAPLFNSQFPNITSAQLALLQAGALVETQFTTGLYINGTDISTIQSDLQNQYNNAQTNLNNTAPPTSGFAGFVYDGYTWSSISTPLNIPSQSVTVSNTPAMTLAGSPSLTDGRLRISAEKTNQSRITIYSPNWCDKTTWYQSSAYVASETVSLNDGDGYYHLAHGNVIDSYHGKITTEDFLKDSNGHSYRVTVTMDGYTKTEQDPHYGTDGDYIVDYHNGIIMPLSWTPVDADTFVVAYHYAGSSAFTLKPAAGKQLLINMAECQFSTDVVMNDTVNFQVYGYAGVFAPQLGYPFSTLIPLTDFKYKSMSDLFNDACKSYPIYPSLGGSGWRGMTVPTTVLDWDYVSQTTLNSAYGMQIVVSLDHNASFTGTFATVTFYCTSE